MPKKIEIPVGEKRNQLTYLAPAGRDKNGYLLIEVQCDCGKSSIIRKSNFGKQKTCGSCFEGKITEHPFYCRWKSIKTRCFNESHIGFKDYGGRGISLAEEWVNDPRSFIEYIESLPNAGEPGLTLDRIDNDGNYEPGNLRWATRSEQNLNQRPSRLRKDNISGVKGVSWNKAVSKWQVQYKGKYIGLFEELEDAAQARLEAEEQDV